MPSVNERERAGDEPRITAEPDYPVPLIARDAIASGAALAASAGSDSLSQDGLIAALVGRGHGTAAICLYLSLSEGAVLARVASLGLPTPPSRPLRLSSGPNAWSVSDVRLLIAGIRSDLSYREIGKGIGRSAQSVGGKARRLGFYRRGSSVGSALLRPARPEVRWVEALDTELSDRWFANQTYQAIARDMEISAAAIRSRATRLGLPRRSRAALVDQFDCEHSVRSPLRASLVRRRCQFSGIGFWGSRNGPRTSPLARKSRRFQLLNGGLSESHAWVTI